MRLFGLGKPRASMAFGRTDGSVTVHTALEHVCKLLEGVPLTIHLPGQLPIGMLRKLPHMTLPSCKKQW